MLIIARRKDRLSNLQASKIMPNNLIFNKESIKNWLELDFGRTFSMGFLGSPSDRSSPPTSMWSQKSQNLHDGWRLFLGIPEPKDHAQLPPALPTVSPPMCLFDQQNNPNVQLNSVWLRHDWKSSWFYLNITWDLFLKIGLVKKIQVIFWFLLVATSTSGTSRL